MNGPGKPNPFDPNPMMKIDKPHQPWGPHVDIITPLGPGIPGASKMRIGPDGMIVNHEINIGGPKINI